MTFGIVCREGTFSTRWLALAKEMDVEVKVIDPQQQAHIIELSQCDAFMWHVQHHDPKEMAQAPVVFNVCRSLGVPTFPNTASLAHFDDKVHQYFLLKAAKYPVVPSQISFNAKNALRQQKANRGPKVFKLKGGAGAQNVVLVRSRLYLYYLILKSFTIGHSQFSGSRYFIDACKGFLFGSKKLVDLFKGLYRLFIPPKMVLQSPRERGYFYTQNFIPGNSFDIRVIVIARKAIAIRRINRPKDFRASGSGNISYDRSEIPLEAVSIAMQVSLEQGYNCMAYDFVSNEKGEFLIVEMSFGFVQEVYDDCPGHWNSELTYIPGKVCLQRWMLESLVNEIG